jgi:hypothetical protein
MRLEQGATYRAELDLPWYASKGMAKSKLEDAGFTSVQVYDSQGKTYAQGTWLGESCDGDLPSQVKQVWRI